MIFGPQNGKIMGTNFEKSVDFWVYFGPKTSNIASKVLKPVLKSFPLYARHLTTLKNSKIVLTWAKVPKGKYAHPPNHPNQPPNQNLAVFLVVGLPQDPKEEGEV